MDLSLLLEILHVRWLFFLLFQMVQLIGCLFHGTSIDWFNLKNGTFFIDTIELTNPTTNFTAFIITTYIIELGWSLYKILHVVIARSSPDKELSQQWFVAQMVIMFATTELCLAGVIFSCLDLEWFTLKKIITNVGFFLFFCHFSGHIRLCIFSPNKFNPVTLSGKAERSGTHVLTRPEPDSLIKNH